MGQLPALMGLGDLGDSLVSGSRTHDTPIANLSDGVCIDTLKKVENSVENRYTLDGSVAMATASYPVSSKPSCAELSEYATWLSLGAIRAYGLCLESVTLWVLV